MKRSKRSQAALKGWATRRANERARSQAAKQGWATRRANERSRAARKGWETRRKKAKVGRVEYVLHFDYGSKRKEKGKSVIRFQLHIQGPKDATDHEAIAAGIAFELGIQKVQGWIFRLITWGHPPKPATNHWQESLQDLYQSAAAVGKKKVAGRNPIPKNRSVEE